MIDPLTIFSDALLYGGLLGFLLLLIRGGG